MCENAYLSIKNPKASRALKWALDPSGRMLASLARLRFAMSATVGLRSWGPPLDQILDPHLSVLQSQDFMRTGGAQPRRRDTSHFSPKNTLTMEIVRSPVSILDPIGGPKGVPRDMCPPVQFLSFPYSFRRNLAK